MYLQNIIKTIISKSGILLLNFVIVILTTQFWGAEGRGVISILMADLAIIVIINNIFSGSSIAFYTPRTDISNILKPAFIWIITITLIGAFFFSQILKHSNFTYLLILTFFTSAAAFNQSVFIGREKLSLYNTYSLLIPAITIIIIGSLQILYHSTQVYIYFWGYGIANITVSVLGLISIKPKAIINQPLNQVHFKNIFNYGYKNELSYFLQFLNYRFTYFVLLYFLGLKDVGLFSIGIAIAESVWILSKSLSLVQYSKIINTKNPGDCVKQTNQLALISALGTLFIGIIVLFVPVQWFTFIFGSGFQEVKEITLWLYPGIFFIAVANIYGHFLAATNRMRPLIIKSTLGLAVTVILSYILIPKLGIIGACITTSSSHLVSSLYIFIAYYRENKEAGSVNPSSIQADIRDNPV